MPLPGWRGTLPSARASGGNAGVFAFSLFFGLGHISQHVPQSPLLQFTQRVMRLWGLMGLVGHIFLSSHSVNGLACGFLSEIPRIFKKCIIW